MLFFLSISSAMSLAAATVPASASPAPPIIQHVTTISAADVTQAIEAGRLDQARLMLGRLIEAGAAGDVVARLTADLDFAAGRDAEALALYQTLLGPSPADATLCERAVIAALRLNAIDQAQPLAACATASPSASWRAWNASGVLADLMRDWTTADKAYAVALRLSGGSGPVFNNLGYSLLLRGEWESAARYFERAHALDPQSMRIANNLELTRAALDKNLPRRLPRESDSDWAARLNDAGVAARILGDRDRATAAFTQALQANGSWYARAANNLADTQSN
jgi:Flp pilus assembly protein TadD